MEYTQEQRDLIKQKGVFPYDWYDSEEKLEFPSLPERKDFDSVLRNEACSEEDYARAQRVWQVFGFKRFEEYLSLYLAGIIFTSASITFGRSHSLPLSHFSVLCHLNIYGPLCYVLCS